MTGKILVLTTAGSEEEAKKIARGLVERRLAACVNIVPRVSSIYRWQGKVEGAEEYLLIAKTEAEHFAQVRDAVKESTPTMCPSALRFPSRMAVHPT
jgi:periplasmic divalent cation tolerance protein